MPFAALLACPYALSSSAQLEIRYTAIELVLSYQHEPEKAQAVPGRGAALKRQNRRPGALLIVAAIVGEVRISTDRDVRAEVEFGTLRAREGGDPPHPGTGRVQMEIAALGLHSEA